MRCLVRGESFQRSAVAKTLSKTGERNFKRVEFGAMLPTVKVTWSLSFESHSGRLHQWADNYHLLRVVSITRQSKSFGRKSGVHLQVGMCLEIQGSAL